MFERFTDEARAVIVHAQAEARDAGDDRIGSEHILLGLLAVPTAAAALLSAHGLEHEAASEAVAAARDEWASRVSGQLPFDASAKMSLEFSLREALQLGHSHIGPEHILLGLLQAQQGLAFELLSPLGVDVAALREAAGSRPQHHASGDGSEQSSRRSRSRSALQRFGVDLTERAREGRLDVVVGRELEAERLVRVLLRKRKNNPVLVGEPGVGKTAVAEALALRIASGDVPENLVSARLVALDMGTLLAGARYRGDFEERLRDVIAEAAASPDLVLFVDEVHTLVGAGSSEGSVDAANILKPALARGELRMIGATTQEEFRKHFESDAALARRFQRIVVAEPSPEDAVTMVLSAVPSLEAHHGVSITPSAPSVAVDLSVRYMTDRRLPDKALDLLDEACALAHMVSSGSDVPPEVSEGLIRQVVQEASGVPVVSASGSERTMLMGLEDRLSSRVVGQDPAVSALARAVRRSRSGLRGGSRPAGSFLFVGPSGVGKTELAKELAQEVFGSASALIALDMGEFSEKHSTSRLFGAPPGYVGHDEGGQLTEKVAARPYSVLLLDEIEKAHPDVFDSLLQMLEEGRMTDGRGRQVDFSNTVVIFTSNLGSSARSAAPLGFSSEGVAEDAEVQRVLSEVSQALPVEFVNRLDETVVFSPLSPQVMRRIVDIQVAELQGRAASAGVSLAVSDEARDFLAAEGHDVRMGARPLRRLMLKLLEDPLSELLVAAHDAELTQVRADVVNGELLVAASRPSLSPSPQL